MIGYDLDDTLAHVEFGMASQRGLANVFRSAKVLRTVTDPFVVITARPHDTTAMRLATRDWLMEHQPGFQRIYYVTGSEPEIIKAKARLIDQLGLDSYTDNNKTIVAELRKLSSARIIQA